MKKIMLILMTVLVCGALWPSVALGDPVDNDLSAETASDAGQPVDVAVATDTATEPATSKVATASDGVDMAPAAPTVEQDPVGAVGRLVAAVRSGNWRISASLVLALLMMALARMRDKVDWFSGDRGGALLVLVLGLGGSMSAALASSAPLDFNLFLGALGVTWMAVGGYTHIKKILWPSDQKAAT